MRKAWTMARSALLIVVAAVVGVGPPAGAATAEPLQDKPSDYFRQRCWISCDPDERTIPALAERFGADRFLWASDFPHADHTPEYVGDLDELAGSFTDEGDRRKFLGDNARSLFQIPAAVVTGGP
jgi:predicted TIM-barrel fold metal-dependent hydrolase